MAPIDVAPGAHPRASSERAAGVVTPRLERAGARLPRREGPPHRRTGSCRRPAHSSASRAEARVPLRRNSRRLRRGAAPCCATTSAHGFVLFQCLEQFTGHRDVGDDTRVAM